MIATGLPAGRDATRSTSGRSRSRARPRPSDGISTGYAPRRTVLDKILVDAAAAAGAEVRERFTVDEVVVEDGAVVGIRGHGDGGTSVVERARVVIGADGRNSHVAKAVQPEQYNEKPMLQWSYYTYWSGLPVDGFETVHPPRPRLGRAPDQRRPDAARASAGRTPRRRPTRPTSRPTTSRRSSSRPSSPSGCAARRARSASPADRCPTSSASRTGPGWALVGDAGYNKDPITAQGISDAFRDAELCATALDEAFTGVRSFDDAMADYQRARDDARAADLRVHDPAGDAGAAAARDAAAAAARCTATRTAMDAFVSITAGTVSPVEFFDPAHIGRIMGAAAASR